MKTLTNIFIGLLAIFLIACLPEEESGKLKFEDALANTVYSYMLENKEDYSSFIEIVDKSGLKATLSAYNPIESGYTLFLPNNDAINQYIANSSQFSSLQELTQNKVFARALCSYHVVNMKIDASSFPFGAFPKQTLSEDYLTVSLIIAQDSSYYRINNKVDVKKTDIEVSNGYVHLINGVLDPVVFSSYGWLEQNPAFSIYKQAVDLTGTRALIDINLKEAENIQAVTLLVEPDSIYNKAGIYNIDDLIEFVNPKSDDYTNELNGLYGFVAYHIISGSYFIDDFVDKNTLYTTFSEIPLNVNGLGFDVAINKGKQVFDTLVYQSDTTIVDFIKFQYDVSNVLSQSGAIHSIDQVMSQQRPSRADVKFHFDEPILNGFRQEGGTFIVDENSLTTIEWSGADLFFVDSGDEDNGAWGNDYLEIFGDFIITYTSPKIIQGKYDVFIRVESFTSDNALIEVFLDDKKLGNTIDLTSGGSSNNPFKNIKLGTIDFNKYSEHSIEIRPLIPGRLVWDFIQFEPI